MKSIHRLIVTSATYRQSSKVRTDEPRLAEIDPRNLLLARQERLRVEAEIVRDAALSASGLLNRQIGGPSVRPPQPDGVYAFTQVNKRWATATDQERLPARALHVLCAECTLSTVHDLRFTRFSGGLYATGALEYAACSR
jgi:hypothetical protein